MSELIVHCLHTFKCGCRLMSNDFRYWEDVCEEHRDITTSRAETKWEAGLC